MRRISLRPREYIASLLIFFLLVSQTIHVSFFDSVSASQEDYRDIVSIFVDETTYDRLESRINRYAEDIQTSLGSTRVSIFVTDENTSVSYIANQNEKLYYEGDGEDDVVSHLVGTILIGDVPVPMVDTLDDQFPSMYPYTDFVDKKFVYNEKTDTYIVHEDETMRIVEPEIWHGVINPAVGREFNPDFIEADENISGSVDVESDIDQIASFLDKTHDFYLQRGVFAPSTLPPRVFYYDGFYESKSFDIQELGAYEVYMENAEQLIYERFSKHFLRYVIAAVDEARKKFNQEEFEFIDSLGIEGTNSDMFPEEQIDTTPDIQTKPMILGLLKKFHQLINEKSLADIRGFVANAGRYNDGQDIRVDQPAVHVSAMDYSAMNTIRKANDKLEDWVDNVEIATPFSTFIMDFLTIKEPIPSPGLGITRHYDNFLFGRKGSTIFDPQSCTIARGSDYDAGPYKQGLLVEANSAFDVQKTMDSVKLYEKDARVGIDCGPVDTEPSTYEVDSYWGKNIITNVDTQNWVFNTPSWTQDFYIPIFSLSGMKEVNQRGFEVIHEGPGIEPANPKHCNAAYSPYPYMLQSGAIREDGPWPNDQGRSQDDISCLTVPEEWTQPTWGGEFNPPTRRLGQEMESHYLVGGEGQCANGMIAISTVGANIGGLIPPYMWACLPAFECPIPEKGKTHYQCIAPQITGYIYSLIPPDSEAPPIVYPNCDTTENKLFSRPCPYNAGNNQERYPTKIPNGEDYQSPCITGLFIFNNAVLPNKRLNYPCFNLAMTASGTTDDSGNGGSSSGGDGMSVQISAISDYTTYETQSFHSIFDSRLYHKSPTLEEIAAAKKSAITPSMAIDHDRHVIFMEESPANKDKKIVYGNLFRFDELEILERHKDRIQINLSDARGRERIRKYGSGAIVITAYRLELDRLGKEQWAGSLPSTEPRFYPPAPSCWGGQLVDSPTCVPGTIDGPLSDEDIVAVIRSNRWLHPDVTKKMQVAVETGLSYSHEYGSGGEFDVTGLPQAILDIPALLRTITGSLSSPPRIPIHTGSYDIAYLGLTHFIPQGDDENVSTIAADGTVFADRAGEYATAREVINAYNMSEEDTRDAEGITPSPSDSCGPPEGVSLLEWPGAIMCWIKSLTPVRIVGYACGANTIGIPADILSNALFGGSTVSTAGMSLSSPTSDHTATVPAMTAYYSGARLTYHLTKNILLPGDAVEARFLYTRDNTLFNVPTEASTRLDVVSIQDRNSRAINISERDRYISIAPNPTTPTEKGSIFVIRAGDNLGSLTLRATMTIPTADGGSYTASSDTFSVRVIDEYLEVTPTVGGRVSTEVAVTSSSGMVFDFAVRNLSGSTLDVRYPISLDIYDDISGARVGTGISITTNTYTLPSEYTRTVGVYRLEFSDSLGRHATQSIAVSSGPIARASFSPVSSAFIRGSNTVVYLRLRDALGNPVAPDLHSVDLTIEGGYFILSDGTKRESLHIDATESEIPLTVGSDIGGTVRISATIENTIRSEVDLRVFENARIVVSRVGTPRVGGESIPVTVRVVDENNSPLTGFRSLVSLSTSPYGGTFSPSVVEINDGISAPMSYRPGTLAGDHRVTASVPGLGNVSDIIFSVLPGVAMYIAHFEDDNTMIFSLRDRYNNIVPVSLPGTLEVGGSPIVPIAFSGGIYEMVKTTGYMTVTVPELQNNSLSYTDSTGPHVIRGIPSYTTFVKKLNTRFDFIEDYNARYTVLAGGSFLRESEDILYNTTPGSGQSLAVTTLLDTPYQRETVFAILPGGGIDIRPLQDVLPEATITLEGGYPRVTVQDLVSNSLITTAQYRASDPRISSCTGDTCMDNIGSDSSIQLESTLTGYTIEGNSSRLSLMREGTALVTILSDGRITHTPGVALSVLSDVTQDALVIEVRQGYDRVGRIYYHTDASERVLTGALLPGSPDTVSIDERIGHFAREAFSHKTLSDTVVGYRFMKRTMNPVYDVVKNGPEDIDSIGMTVNTPGIGWKDNNRMLLSYAGGDTVGQASRWYQSYTLINLGDPVAHVDKRAVGTEIDGIDRTLGEQLTSSREVPVKSYAHRDMDNDGFEDLVVLHADGFVELLQNLGDRIKHRGKIAYVPDISNRGFDVGDFTNDGYADLLGVDQEGYLILLSNNTRQFTRMGVRVSTGELPPVGVTQLKIRDMDNDSRDDIVYLTEGGELSILYGTTTPGLFDKRLLDPTLGITLSRTPIKGGGAIYMNSLPQVSLQGSTVTGSLGVDEAIIWNEVYTPFLTSEGARELEADISDAETFASLEEQFNTTYSRPENTYVTTERNFARTEYAEAFNLDISKTYALGTGSILRSGEKVRIDIQIRNTGNTPLTGVEYLDMVPAIFSDEDTRSYTVTSGSESITREYTRAPSSEFTNYFRLVDIPAGRSITLSYEVTALPASYGELLVGDFEIGETGADAYGDVAFNTDTTCGADMLLWRSTDVREYERGTRTFSDPVLGADIAAQIQDVDQNGVLDHIQDISQEEKEAIFDRVTDSPGVGGSPVTVTQDGRTVEVGYDEGAVDEMETMITDIYQTLGGCGRRKDGCLTFPINYAPLASGKDPVAFGYPIGDGFMVGEGVPMFSALTRFDLETTFGCYQIPVVWPVAPLRMEAPGCSTSNNFQAWGEAVQSITEGYAREAQAAASGLGNLGIMALLNGASEITEAASAVTRITGAGGYVGVYSPANQLRIFATPTLTLGAGVGICFGGPARVYGGNPPPAVWPLSQIGNCLVVTDSLNICKNDGSISDVDIRGTVGLGSINETWNTGNGTNMPGSEACSIKAKTAVQVENQAFTNDIIDYIRAPSQAKLPALYNKFSQKAPRTSTSAGPLISLGGASEDSAIMSVEVAIDLAKPLTTDNIINLKNKRIAGFPDFIMDWVSRQTDELINGFFTLPKLKIITPTSIGQNAHYNGSLTGTLENWGSAYSQVLSKGTTEKMGTAYDNEVRSQGASTSLTNRTRSTTVNATSDIGRWMQETQNSFDATQDSAFQGELGKIADQGKGGIAAIRSAYKLIGNLPFVSIREQDVPIDVPWILPQELDRYSRSLDAYAREVNAAIANYCLNDPSPECANRRASINAGPLLASINQNLKRIEEYKNLPVKIQKYITWKQRYLAQILCYIEEVQQMTTGWLKDNSIRFRKWAELIVLLRAIADGWQPLLDILAQKDAYCSVCHNERYNAKYWKYKLISLLIPSLPVIKFPRLPDIILDLRDVRLGVVIAVPNFRPNLKPIRLPNIPSFSLPTLPGVTIGALDLLPPLPPLPDLPDLPAIPTIKLPNLPPPLKLPKILDEFKLVLKILKLWKLLECYLNKTPFVPEWTLGDVIAQRTERYGYLPIDFIDISLPQVTIPWTREIRVSSHVNYEIRSEFITEFARAAVAPINEFTTDFGRSLPRQLGENVNIEAPSNINVDLQSYIDTASGSIAAEIERLESEKDIYLDIDEFKNQFLSNLASIPELAHISERLEDSLEKVTIESDRETAQLIAKQNARYDTLRKYVELQYNETAELQNIVDLLTQDDPRLLSDSVERLQFVSDESRRASSALVEELERGEDISLTLTREESQFYDLPTAGKNLQNSVRRLAANVGNSTNSSAVGATSQAYSPVFQGIYIVTEGGHQTRLFDYTELLSQDAPSTRTDIDNDGDLDYLYIMDGALYLKRTTLRDPTKIIDTEVTVQDMTSDIPTAPNFFRENVSLPNTLSLEYTPAKTTETAWRIELYDRYLEWDRVRMGEDTLSPRHVIDVLRKTDTYREQFDVQRSLDRVENPEDFVIEGPRLQVLTGGLDFILSPGRTLYTGDRTATILYASGNTTPTERKVIGAHKGYSFTESMSIRLEQGSLYIVYPSIVAERYTFTDDMIGMPILPGMQLISPTGEIGILDHERNDTVTIEPDALYHVIDGREFAGGYPIQLDYPNGYYHAMIHNLDTANTVSAGETLLTPQLSSDMSAPDIDLRDTIRVPVYQTRTIMLRDVVTDTNDYRLTIDGDATQDTNGNGIYDDDFVSTGATVSVTSESLTIGPYDTLGRRYMMLRVVDEFYNTTYLPVTVEIYSPIPTIQSGTMTGGIDGRLSEPLQNQPIDLFRVRPATDITPLSSGAVLSQSGGVFDRDAYQSQTGVLLSSSGSARVLLSYLGLPLDTTLGYQTRVVLASDSNPLHVVLSDASGRSLYRQYFALSRDTILRQRISADDTATGALVMSPSTGYTLVGALATDPSIPGGYYLVDASRRAVLAVARDGNIYPVASGVTATYSDNNGYPRILVRNASGTLLDLEYRFDFFYTAK